MLATKITSQQLNRVRGQQGDFQPIRLAGVRRHQAALVPLPAGRLGPNHGHQQHAQQHYHQQRQRQLPQHNPKSAAPPWAHRRHASKNNLSSPPSARQDHRTSNFMSALNERVYLSRINQHHQQQRPQALDSAPSQIKSPGEQLHGERQRSRSLVSDRRTSSSSWSPNHLLHEGQQTKFSQLQADGAPAPTQTSEGQTAQLEQPQASGKLLICYYTTRQTAPYWPKEAREFVIPAERLSSVMGGNGADTLDPTLQQWSSVNVGSFNDRYPNYQRPEAKNMDSKYSEQPKVVSADGERRQMILVAPRFAPFNRTMSADSSQQRSRSGGGPLTQLFFMSPTSSPAASHHHHLISNRQDNVPLSSTLVGAGGPSSVPPPPGGESLSLGPPASGGQNNGVLGGVQLHQQVSQAAYNLISASSPIGSTNAGGTLGREPQSSRLEGSSPVGRINNGESDAANFVQMRQQYQSMDTLLAAPPPTSRTSIGSGSSYPAAASSWTTSSARDSSDEIHPASLPTSPNVMSNNYYYYYNNQQASSPTTTVSFPTSPGALQSSLNGGTANLQRAKSIQMAESELSPALQMGVSNAPVAQTSASFSAGPLASVAPPGAQQTASAGMGISSTGPTIPPQHHHEQLLKVQASQMVPLSQKGDEQKATTALALNWPSSTVLSLSSVATTSGATSRPNSPIVLTADDLLIAGRQQQSSQHQQQQHDGDSLSSALVSSPLSTVFDVFGAASQYLMRFKPSSLISPGAFSSNFNSQTGHLANLAQQQRQSTSGSLTSAHNLKSNSSSLFSGAAASFISFPFSNGLLATGSGQLAKSIDSSGSASSERTSNSTSSKGGFLSRLTALHGSNQQHQQQQRREDICGRTIQTPERRIIGGEGAKYGEFPYQVHIKIAKHQCGGALVDRQSIVTAAHCVYHFITRAPVSKLQIVIGAYDIEDEQYQELPPQYFKVNKVKLHPNFRFSASHPDRYDIAILKLDKPVKYTDNVLPVCLPGKDLRFENMVGTVTGFGKTDPSLSNRYGTRLLQKVDVPIIENNECERWHRTRGIDLKIFPEMMCAGYEDGLKDACVGDSGGPLVVKTPVGSNGSFRWTLAGITSAGFGCAQSRQPGIYHRVSHTVDWILENLD